MDGRLEEGGSCRRPAVDFVADNLLEDRVPAAVRERGKVAVPREGCGDHDADDLVAIERRELQLGERSREPAINRATGSLYIKVGHDLGIASMASCRSGRSANVTTSTGSP